MREQLDKIPQDEVQRVALHGTTGATLQAQN